MSTILTNASGISPKAFEMFGSHFVLGETEEQDHFVRRSPEEMSEAAYAYFGRKLLGELREDYPCRVVSLPDWEHVAVEHPREHSEVKPLVLAELAALGLEAPSFARTTTQLASVALESTQTEAGQAPVQSYADLPLPMAPAA